MIAASEPQEFVPSGRQQASRHPGPPNIQLLNVPNINEDLVLDQLEKVSLKEKREAEWWILRKVPDTLSRKDACDAGDAAAAATANFDSRYSPQVQKSLQSDYYDDSLSLKSMNTSQKFRKRISDQRFSSKQFSNESLMGRSDAKYSSFSRGSPVENVQSVFQTKSKVDYMEEELYVKENTVIWSRGLVTNSDSGDNGRKIVCSYTSPMPVKHALWCTFHCERPSYDSNLLDVEEKETADSYEVPSICVIDSHNIRAFTPKGEDFVIAIPFQVGNVWSTKYGILIEKEVDAFSKDFPENRGTLYSLAYPLDEVCPVAVNVPHLQILINNNCKVVYTSENPSLCMLYDFTTKQHTLYHVRKVKPNEKVVFFEKEADISTCPSTTLSNKLKTKFSMWECLKNTNYQPIPSPMSSRPASVSSFSNLHQSRSHSPMAALSRCQSPAVSSTGSPWLQRLSRLSTSYHNEAQTLGMSSRSFFDSSKAMSHLHMSPTICLDYLWTDNASSQDDSMSPASKVFLCDDLTGQWYLCYLIAKYQLYVVKTDFTANGVGFGTATSISAKDAVPIPNLHMMAILEHSGNVTLYSGLTAVGKLHIGGTLVQHTPSPFVRRNLSLISPFPRRSSLLPHSKPTEIKFDEHLFSPVFPEGVATARPSNVLQLNFPPEGNIAKTALSGLRDSIENRMTLIYSDGTYYRITLPSLASNSLVESCLVALRQCLVKDTAMVLLVRWYATKNAFGTQDINVEEEWEMFEALLFELLGYSEEPDQLTSPDCPVTPSSNPKRKKQSTSGTDEDWSFLTGSYHQTKMQSYLSSTLKMDPVPPTKHPSKHPSIKISPNSVLFPHIRLIHYCLHLLYEDLKLNTLRSEDLLPLAQFLNRLACDLGLKEYALHYWKDFPEYCKWLETPSPIPPGDLKNIGLYSFLEEKPASIMHFVHDLISGNNRGANHYPFVRMVNSRSKDIVQVCGVIAKEHYPETTADTLVKAIGVGDANGFSTFCECKTGAGSVAEQATLLMKERGFTVQYLDTLPVGIYLLLYGSLWKCRENPPSDWTAEAYYLLWRDDLAALYLKGSKKTSEIICDKSGPGVSTQLQGILPSSKVITDNSEREDGMEHVNDPLMKLRFADDVRVDETRKMLQSARPVPVVVQQRPDVSDHDFIEEQEKHLYAICTRTLALSTGRGMFTLRTFSPVTTEPLEPPHLCLTGKAPPRGTTVELTHIDVPANMNQWPLFHNGAANGLRITPDAHNIDNSWIVFNRSKQYAEHQPEHAGFLMALGLNGHLKNLDYLITYDYLSKCNEFISIGLILGLSAAFRGTCHGGLTKALSIHVENLQPPTSMEIDISQNIQVASLLGIGLLYQGTSHRHIIEVLLAEIGRPPGPEMENSVDRESYSLAAGLSLGLVMLKQGGNPLGLSDLNVPDILHYYMVGGNKRPLTGSQKDKYKVASFQIREGSSVNLDVTAPGATIALGLMYLGTNNKAVADWMAPPETQYLLDFVRPDFLMFRILSRCLILWDEVEPSKEWVENQVPDTIRPYCMIKPVPTSDIDYEAMNQAYCNIVTGACFALGLKYAGSADENAFKTLLHFCHMFTRLTGRSISDLAGKPTVETCLNVLLISTAMVMAGTGCLEVMRLVRLLRRRVGVGSSAIVTYGSHLAIHMALGLLFLGGGRYTLSNSPSQIAALICAFYPKFPTHSNDNRYHLQAFRHLYVLAVEPRLIVPRDVHSGVICYAKLRIVKLDGATSVVSAPGIIPDLGGLMRVAIDDERYWPVVFEKGRNWDLLTKILAADGHIDVKQRAGCLSYMEDKFGYHSQLARTLTASKVIPWDPSPSAIMSFTHDQTIKFFCDHFLKSDGLNTPKAGLGEGRLQQMITKVTYDAVVKDKLVVVPVFTFLARMVYDLQNFSSAFNQWQLKLITAQTLNTSISSHMIPSDVILAVHQGVVKILDSWEPSLKPSLRSYLQGEKLCIVCSEETSTLKRLGAFVTYYDLPFGFIFPLGELLEVLVHLQDTFASATAQKMAMLALS